LETSEINHNVAEICFFDEILLHLNDIKYSIPDGNGQEWVDKHSFNFWNDFFRDLGETFISINGELFDSKCATSHYSYSLNPHKVDFSLISIQNTRLAQKLLMNGEDYANVSLIEITNSLQSARIIAKVNTNACSLRINRPKGMHCIERCLIIDTIYCMIQPVFPKVFKINTDNSIEYEEVI
jgi:hypothetical protein